MTDEFEVRAYEPQDESAVVELWETVFPDAPPWNNPPDVIERKLSVQRDLFLVCLSGGRLVGTVLAGFDGVRGWVHKVAAHPEFQRKGIATHLMKAAEERLASIGCPKLNIQLRASNTSAVKFYESAGYAIEDRVSMSKRLE